MSGEDFLCVFSKPLCTLSEKYWDCSGKWSPIPSVQMYRKIAVVNLLRWYFLLCRPAPPYMAAIMVVYSLEAPPITEAWSMSLYDKSWPVSKYGFTNGINADSGRAGTCKTKLNNWGNVP